MFARLSCIFLVTLVIATMSACTSSSSSGPKGSVEKGQKGSYGYGVSRDGTGKYALGSQEELFDAVGDRVFFDLDSAVLNASAQKTLERQSEWLNRYPELTVTIEGHCDERGTREYNLALGERRAAAAKQFLVSLGIKASRVNTISYGKERPAVLGSNESAWGENRRAVTVVNQ